MAWNEPGGKGNNPKDPWGNNNRGNNNGGGNQPPDLDEVIRKLTDKVNGFFGGKGSGSNNSSGGGDDGSIVGFLIVAGIVVVILLAMNSFYTVDEQERGVVLRTGKYHSLQMPGPHFKIPVLEEVIKVNTTQVREAEIRESMLTEDENIIDAKLFIQYRVSDPEAFALRVENPEATLMSAAESALRHEVGSNAMDPILTNGRAIISGAVTVRLQSYLDRYDTGMTIVNAELKETTPPAAVKDAFDDVQRAKNDKEKIINNSEAYANSVVPEARGRAQRQLEEARAYKERVVARAQGEADRFTKLLTEYNKAPDVTRERLYIDAVTSVYSSSSKVLMDVEGGNNMMYLPLDKIMQSVKTTDGDTSMNDRDISRLTDEVLKEARARQSTNTVRREGR
jgi:membrane protease subunit HflK